MVIKELGGGYDISRVNVAFLGCRKQMLKTKEEGYGGEGIIKDDVKLR